MKTRAKTTRGNTHFRDDDYSPARGSSLWESCPILAMLQDPAVGHVYFNDFHVYTAGDWTVTVVDGGTDGAATQVVTGEAGGVLLCSTDDAENDGINFNLKGEAFKLASSKPLWYEIRLKASEATQSDFMAGLTITDADLLGGITDGVYFRKVDGATAVAFVTEKDSSETATAGVHTFAANTYVKLGLFFDGAGTVYGYVNGVLAATHTLTIPDDEELTIAHQYLTGATGVDTVSFDFVKCAQIR